MVPRMSMWKGNNRIESSFPQGAYQNTTHRYCCSLERCAPRINSRRGPPRDDSQEQSNFFSFYERVVRATQRETTCAPYQYEFPVPAWHRQHVYGLLKQGRAKGAGTDEELSALPASTPSSINISELVGNSRPEKLHGSYTRSV